MIIYFAGAEPMDFINLLKDISCENVLISYFQVKNKDLEEYSKKMKRVFLDSGAFSAFTQNKEINIYKYIDFLKEQSKYLEVFANLDVIGNPEETLKNQNIIKEADLIALPVVHFGADMKFLHEYAKNYDYIALGGLVPLSKNPPVLRNWLNKCFKELIPYIKDKNLRVHGFGLTNPTILIRYPFYSVDSTSWLAGAQYGTIYNWDKKNFKIQSAMHYSEQNKMIKYNVNKNAIEEYRERLKHNVKEMIKMQDDITKLWEKRNIKYN